MRLLFDMDDVLENLSYVWVEWLNNKYGLNVERESMREWEIYKYFPTLSREQIYEPFALEEFWDTVTPLDGAVNTLEQLIREGHNIFIVTSTNYRNIRIKMDRVLFKHFPFLTWDNVIVTNHKELVRGDILFDDGLHNLSVPQFSSDMIRVVFDAPWNRGGDDLPLQDMVLRYVDYRVRSWDEVKELIHTIMERRRRTLFEIATKDLEKENDNQ